MSTTPVKQRKRNKRWLSLELPSVEEIADIPDEVLATRILPKGFYLWFLMHHMRTMCAALSEDVFLTRGVLDYLYDYTRWGPNKAHNTLFLCAAFNRDNQCHNGFLCREVHCSLSVDAAVEASTYNVFSNANGSPTLAEEEEGSPCVPQKVLLRHSLHSRWTPSWAYPTLPKGVIFRVALPNSPKPVEEYDSGRLFVTKVVRDHYDRLLRNEAPVMTLQHCANFSKYGVCCFGESCQFVHVVHYGVRPESLTSDDTKSVASERSNDNVSPISRSRSRKGKNASISDGTAGISKTSQPTTVFSALSSPGASLTGVPLAGASQSSTFDGSFTTAPYLMMPPPVVQTSQQPPKYENPQSQQQCQQLPYMPPERLSCFSAMGAPFLMVPEPRMAQPPPQPEHPPRQVFTFMAPSPDGQIRMMPQLYVMPY